MIAALMLAWSLAAASPPPPPQAIHLEDVAGIELEGAMKVSLALAHAVDARLGFPPAIDDSAWVGCSDESRCLAEIGVRTQAEEIVLLRVLAAPARIRLLADRARVRGGAVLFHAELELARNEDLDPPLIAFAAALYPDVTAPQPRLQAAPLDLRPIERARAAPWPWIALAVSGIATGVGVVFGLDSKNAIDTYQRAPQNAPDYARLKAQGSRSGLAADLLFGAGAVSAAGSLALFVFD